jgi:MYXO-CTERM domain-containing protein
MGQLLSRSVFALSLVVLLFSRTASARSAGITSSAFPNAATGCNGCHTSNVNTPTVTLTAGQACIYTGGNTLLSTTITNSNIASDPNPSGMGGGGWNLRITGGAGTLGLGGTDSALTQVLSGEITHMNGPKLPSDDGLIHFSAMYNAPSTPTVTTLVVWGNAVNGNGNNQGDHAGTNSLVITVAAHAACAANSCGVITDACGGSIDCGGCTLPNNSCVNGQCVCTPNPNACGGRTCGTVDNGCGTQVTCGTCTVPATCSADGQCFCVPLPNPCAGRDCGVVSDGCGGVVSCGICTAPQVCGAFAPNVCDCPAGTQNATCGVGACLRMGTSCLASSCTPGTPGVEVCNGMDDDCDGVPDNDAPCPAGSICMAGACVFPGMFDAGADADAESTVADGSPLESNTMDVASAADVVAVDAVDAAGSSQDAVSGPAPDGSPMTEASASFDVGTGVTEAATPNEAAIPKEAAGSIEAATPVDASSPPIPDDAMAADEPIQPGSTVEAGDDAGPPVGSGGTEAGSSHPVDAAILADGRARDATASEASAGAGGSGGDIPPDGPSGCSCRVGADRRPPAGWLLLVAGAALLRARRKGSPGGRRLRRPAP